MNETRKLIIYYFSGTGNSKNIAHWFANVANNKGFDCEIFNIAQIDRLNMVNPIPGALIAFISPVHGFNYPPVMLHFILRFPSGKNQVLLLNTRAGMLIGKFITPGLSGITFYLSALILKIKGFSIKAMFPVDLPSNWISLHPGLNEHTVKFLYGKNFERVDAFANRVLSGKRDFRSLREIVQDMLVSPISIIYYLVGRFFISRTFIASRDCNDCGLCIKSCPVKAIKKVDNRPFWTFNCESCMKCIGNCPHKAIEVAHGFFAGFILLMVAIMLPFFYRYFELFGFKLEPGLIKNILDIIIYLALLELFYRIVHFLMRFSIFERLVIYTSLTKYQFWGRKYKAPKYNN